MSEQIELPALDSRRRPTVSEILEAERLGPNNYRLVHSPGLVEGLAAGDEIELRSDEPSGYRVLKRSGNVCVWVIVSDRAELHQETVQAMRRQIEAIGGYLDGGTHRSLIFTIPVSAGFTAIEGAFDTVKAIPGASWFFGNIYDPSDGETPLNWW